jgi:adenylylsulfate kinase
MRREQKGVTLWLTGLSGSGKTTISSVVAERLKALGYGVEVLDGDMVRQNLASELGFSKKDRDENIRRIAFVAHLLTRNNVIVIVAAISPYRALREEIRQRIGDFVEVFVNSPLEVCEKRDIKGLYKKARTGLVKNFTGVDDPYEPPLNAEIECKTDQESIIESSTKILAKLSSLNYIDTIATTPCLVNPSNSSVKIFGYD